MGEVSPSLQPRVATQMPQGAKISKQKTTLSTDTGPAEALTLRAIRLRTGNGRHPELDSGSVPQQNTCFQNKPLTAFVPLCRVFHYPLYRGQAPRNAPLCNTKPVMPNLIRHPFAAQSPSCRTLRHIRTHLLRMWIRHFFATQNLSCRTLRHIRTHLLRMWIRHPFATRSPSFRTRFGIPSQQKSPIPSSDTSREPWQDRFLPSSGIPPDMTPANWKRRGSLSR